MQLRIQGDKILKRQLLPLAHLAPSSSTPQLAAGCPEKNPVSWTGGRPGKVCSWQAFGFEFLLHLPHSARTLRCKDPPPHQLPTTGGHMNIFQG